MVGCNIVEESPVELSRTEVECGRASRAVVGSSRVK